MARSSPEIVEIRTYGADGTSQVFPYRPGMVHVVSDKHPKLDVRVRNAPLTVYKKQGKHLRRSLGKWDAQPGAEGACAWQCWSLGEVLARDRRLGRYELRLSNPRGSRLICYVVPERLLEVPDLWAMISTIQDELDFAATWIPSDPSTIRTHTDAEAGSSWSATRALLDAVGHELRAARALSRQPIREHGRVPGVLQLAPEHSLVAHWAVRRQRQLVEQLDRLEPVLDHWQRIIADPMPKNRRPDIEEAVRHTQRLVADALGLRKQLSTLTDVDALSKPVPYGPLVQRDHRLRRLLRAFTPTHRERAALSSAHLSRYPPTSLNDLFELWGATWLVQRFRALGFKGAATWRVADDRLHSCSWHLRRGSVEVFLDFEVHPAWLDISAVPPVHERDLDAVQWAADRHTVDPLRPYLGTRETCSPDYLLRFQGPTGRLLAVGDASLADPAYQQLDSEQSKVTTVASYRRSLYWKADQELVPCHPLGAFVVYPGPTREWADAERQAWSSDVWVLCPRPQVADPEADRRCERMLGLLVDTVSMTSPEPPTDTAQPESPSVD